MPQNDAYLSFWLEDQRCCLPVDAVEGVVRALPNLSRLNLARHGASNAVTGITHLRGRMATVISLRRQLSLTDFAGGAPAHIIVEDKGDLYCLGVDAVEAVVHFDAAHHVPTPRHLPPAWQAIVSGILRQGDDSFALIDTGVLLSPEGLEAAS